MFFITSWKGANPEENLDLFKQLFLVKPLKWGKYLQKLDFLPKVSHIQLNNTFMLIWSIFGEIHRELLFLVQKVTISEKSREILRKFVFLNMFEKGNILRKIWICLNNFFLNKFEKRQILRKTWFCLNKFFDQTCKMGKILTKTCFSPQSEPHTGKLCFFVVWSIFREIHRELLFLIQKVANSEKSTDILRKFVFLN